MSPADLARLHALCFQTPRPWSAAEFTGFLDDPTCFLCDLAQGFALGRVVVGEAELLTIAVDPRARRTGVGKQLLGAFETGAKQREAAIAFLEVASDNAGAIALYQGAGYSESGRRPGYYQRPDGSKIDAILMKKVLFTA